MVTLNDGPTFDEVRGYEGAALGLTVLILVPSLVFLVLALSRAHRRGDGARSWVAFFKATYFAFILLCVLKIVVLVLSLIYLERGVFGVSLASLYVDTIVNFLERIVHIGIILTLVSLGAGISIARDGHISTVDTMAKIISWAGGAVLVILSVVVWGMNIHVLRVFDDPNRSVNDYDTALTLDEISTNMNFAIIVVLWVAALAQGVRAVMALSQANGNGLSSKPNKYVLFCSVFLLATTTWWFAFYLAYVDLGANITSFRFVDVWTVILEALFSTYAEYFIFLCLYRLAVAEKDGVWSTGHRAGDPSIQDPAEWGATQQQPQQRPTWNHTQ